MCLDEGPEEVSRASMNRSHALTVAFHLISEKRMEWGVCAFITSKYLFFPIVLAIDMICIGGWGFLRKWWSSAFGYVRVGSGGLQCNFTSMSLIDCALVILCQDEGKPTGHVCSCSSTNPGCHCISLSQLLSLEEWRWLHCEGHVDGNETGEIFVWAGQYCKETHVTDLRVRVSSFCQMCPVQLFIIFEIRKFKLTAVKSSCSQG